MVRGKSPDPAPASTLPHPSSPSQARKTPLCTPVPSIAGAAAAYAGMPFLARGTRAFSEAGIT